jgi:mannose-6-phosphate isomerase
LAKALIILYYFNAQNKQRMPDKNKIFKITGKIQHYQWGGYQYIPKLLGIDNKENKPFAEYWLGAHDNAPAQLDNGEGLHDFIRRQPEVLGEKAAKQFGRLPYLLKVLDVKDMLSIQVHPNKQAAVYEFEKEHASGKALNAPDRNYKDDNHKPELMLALGDFWLLHGFRLPENLKKSIESVPEFAFMLPVFEAQGYKGLYALLMNLEQEKVNAILQPVLDRILPLYKDGKLQKDQSDFWAARAALTYNQPGKIDRGIFSIYLFNVVFLKKGEAVFQDAGVLHAYLEGQNIEIMANSDNVLRGGLTPKHIDVAELMKHVVFEPTDPQIISGIALNNFEKQFPTSAPDFELSSIAIKAGESYACKALSTDIFLVGSGQVAASTEESGLQCLKGEAFVGFCGTSIMMNAIENTIIYRATLPVNKPV